MTTDNNTQTITNPISFKVEPPENNQPIENKQTEQQQTPPPAVTAPTAFKTFQTQEDFDNETAKIRGVAERKAENEILKALGIDSKDKLEAIKQAYEKSKTDEERRTEQLQQLDGLKSELAEKDAIIVALTKLSGKETSEVTKLVKMAKGLVGDDYSIEQALDEVMKMAQVQPNNQQPVNKIPVSQPISAGTAPIATENPFKTGNLTEIGKMIKENPEQARQLAKSVNYPVTW